MKKVFTGFLAIALCLSLAAPAYAAQNPFAQMEAQSHRAVEAAIKAGTVPAGTSVYDCMYGADKNGVTIVIQYKDKKGNWIDVSTGVKASNPQSPTASVDATKALTEDELKAYADTVFELVNKEREQSK